MNNILADSGEDSPTNPDSTLCFDASKYRLGSLCRRGHDWNGTGQSLRLVKKGSKYGDCAECRSLTNKQYYEANREGEKERYKAYEEANREKLKERRKAYREVNHESIKEREKAFREANREKLNQKARAYHHANREKCSQKGKAYREANREKVREYNLNYRKAHPRLRKGHDKAYREKMKQSPEWCEAQRIYNRLYRKLVGAKYRAKQLEGSRKRRALKRQCHTAPYQHQDIENLKSKFNHQCAYCGDTESKLTIDHFIPIAKGGSDCLGNFLPACSTCNCSKNKSDALEWYKRQPFYSEKRWQFILEVLGKTKGDYRQLPLF